MKKRGLAGIALLLGGVAMAQTESMDPKWTEVWEPQPTQITPGNYPAPPSDAVVLFANHLDEWKSRKNGEKANWKVDKEGFFTVTKGEGDLISKREFGDLQLHIEWRSPAEIKGEGQGRGNSGIFLQDRYEIQVLDNYENKTYCNGQAGSVYKQTPPMVNACRKPGEWQSYDIVFLRPRFDATGRLIRPGYVTVLHNGVAVQVMTEIKGETVYRGYPFYKAHEKAPIRLQDHGDAVSFRNIWVRELE